MWPLQELDNLRSAAWPRTRRTQGPTRLSSCVARSRFPLAASRALSWQMKEWPARGSGLSTRGQRGDRVAAGSDLVSSSVHCFICVMCPLRRALKGAVTQRLALQRPWKYPWSGLSGTLVRFSSCLFLWVLNVPLCTYYFYRLQVVLYNFESFFPLLRQLCFMSL